MLLTPKFVIPWVSWAVVLSESLFTCCPEAVVFTCWGTEIVSSSERNWYAGGFVVRFLLGRGAGLGGGCCCCCRGAWIVSCPWCCRSSCSGIRIDSKSIVSVDGGKALGWIMVQSGEVVGVLT